MNLDRLTSARTLLWSVMVLLVGLAVACNRQSRDSPSSERAVTDQVVAQPDSLAQRQQEPQPSQATVVTRAIQSRQAAYERTLDPTQDGWASEAISESIRQRLERLLSLALASQAEGPESKAILSEGFTVPPLRPGRLGENRFAGDLRVRTISPDQSTDRNTRPSETYSWPDAAKLLFAPLRGGNEPRAHVKVTRLEMQASDPGLVTTQCLIEVSARDDLRIVEQHLNWNCAWKLGSDAIPRLRHITVQGFQETESAGRWFTDRTLDVTRREPVYRQQLRHGLNHWLSRIEVTHGMYVFAEYGLAVADVNGDGLEDLYVCQPGGLPNRLLVHQVDGAVRDTASEAGVDWLDHTSSALFVDFDNDADQDLAIAMENRRVLLMENSGEGKFQVVQELTIEDRHVQGLCAADFDNDTQVDLYLTVGFADERARPGEPRAAFTYHDANEGGANILFRNNIQNGKWQFRDVTRDVGLDRNNRRHSLAAAWEDFDNDGDQDLYVANDYGQNCLYRNDGGSFTDIATAANVIDFGSGMSVSWSDYDRDGWMDLYVGNMFSSAGSRVTRQKQFRPESDDSTRQLLERFAKGNTLFQNRAGQAFEEPDRAGGAQMGRWAWSSPFADLNNDGWADLFVTNGYVTGDDQRDL